MSNLNFEALNAAHSKLQGIIDILPEAAIVGGYIRDILLDKPHRDIDIMTEVVPTNEQTRALEKHLGVYLYAFNPEQVENYIMESNFVRTSDILQLWKDEDNNLVDVIVVQNLKQHIKDFPDNLSRVWYDKDGVGMMSEFVYGHANKLLRYRTGAPPARLEKLKTKFPDYTVKMTPE